MPVSDIDAGATSSGTLSGFSIRSPVNSFTQLAHGHSSRSSRNGMRCTAPSCQVSSRIRSCLSARMFVGCMSPLSVCKTPPATSPANEKCSRSPLNRPSSILQATQSSRPTPLPTAEQYLRPEVIRTVARLDLRARFIVEGFLSGLHASPFHGFSVEFSEHRRTPRGTTPRTSTGSSTPRPTGTTSRSTRPKPISPATS